MRQLLLLLAVAAAGCASGSTTGTTSTPVVNAPTRVMGRSETNSDVVINPEVSVVRTALAVPAERSFAALPSVYGDLGIPVTRTDAAHLQVGNPRLTVSARLANERMSHWLDCGRSGLGEPIADSYRIRLDLQSAVVPSGSGSEVQTVIRATAQSPDGASRDPVICNSTGRLEKQIATLLMLRLAR